MPEQVLIAGVGVTPFTSLDACSSTSELVGRAVQMALDDARIDPDLIDQVFMASVSTGVGVCEQLLMQIGITGIPLFCMRDGGVSASTAVHLARSNILAGEAEAILVVGFEAMRTAASKRAFFGLDEYTEDDQGHASRSDDPLSMLALRDHPGALYAAQMDWMQAHLEITDACFSRVQERARMLAGLAAGAEPERGEWLPPYLCPPARGAAAALLCSTTFANR